MLLVAPLAVQIPAYAVVGPTASLPTVSQVVVTLSLALSPILDLLVLFPGPDLGGEVRFFYSRSLWNL